MDWTLLFWNIFYNVILPVIAIYLAPLISEFIYNFLFAKINNEKLRGWFSKACLVVSSVNQEYVSGIKKGREDGKLTPDEEKTARAMAVKKLMEMVGSGINESIAGTLIESALDAAKKDKSPVSL